jgi:hypothetical protein
MYRACSTHKCAPCERQQSRLQHSDLRQEALLLIRVLLSTQPTILIGETFSRPVDRLLHLQRTKDLLESAFIRLTTSAVNCGPFFTSFISENLVIALSK